MILDLEEVPAPEQSPADVCIVGAGAAGILLAVELARGGRRVRLLESGGLREEPATQELYRSEVAGLKHNGIHGGRFRIYGGSTTKWGGQILELSEQDFAERPWIRGSGWPFPRQSLESYYARALELEGLGRVTREDREVWRELGLDLPEMGPEITPYLTRWCPEPNLGLVHGDFLRKNGNVEVYLHANACEMLLAGDGKTIRGIRAKTLTGREAVFTADRYVLCLGGIESARFLLQPGAGAALPWQQNGLLGRHYQDHVEAACADLLDVHPHLFHAYFDNIFSRGFKYQPKFRLLPVEQQKAQILNATGAVAFVSGDDEALVAVKQLAKSVLRRNWGAIRAADLSLALRNFPTLFRQFYRYQVQRRAFHPANSTIRLGITSEQEPLGESSITLSRDRDALGLFRARLDWRVSELELKTIRIFAAKAKAALEARQLARVVIDPGIMDDDDFLRSRVNDTYHHMGGVRMAASPSEGVVDLDLKIHGTANAYVCSSAVFPSSGTSNPTHTLLALAVRLADHLKGLST
jgi:choline dehydrogenase-like flavoprotein